MWTGFHTNRTLQVFQRFFSRWLSLLCYNAKLTCFNQFLKMCHTLTNTLVNRPDKIKLLAAGDDITNNYMKFRKFQVRPRSRPKSIGMYIHTVHTCTYLDWQILTQYRYVSTYILTYVCIVTSSMHPSIHIQQCQTQGAANGDKRKEK